jgi:hypothetical protein
VVILIGDTKLTFMFDKVEIPSKLSALVRDTKKVLVVPYKRHIELLIFYYKGHIRKYKKKTKKHFFLLK